jgi:hypothetical protein
MPGFVRERFARAGRETMPLIELLTGAAGFRW